MKIDYLQRGHGPHKVIVLSGWFGGSSDWHAMLPALDIERFTYLFFDYRGYGRALARDGEFTFEEAARDVLEAADSLGWERFSLVGHSMGGMAMQRVLLAAPERIGKMAGISAVPACGSRMDEARLAAFRAAIDDVDKRAAIIAFSTGNRLPPQWSAHLARESVRLSRTEAFAAYLPQWAATDISASVAGQPVPVKLFVGEHDPTLTQELMQRTWLAWYPQAMLELLPNAGHYAMHEIPLALASSLQAWLTNS
jgi:pimeloyl-ACP methyl ester carboxylesterase